MQFTEEQQKFINTESSQLLLEAPAGSGKTETVAERVRTGVESGKNIQLACFTHNARRTLQSRLDSSGINLQVRTVVSLAHELLIDELGDTFEVGDGASIAREVCARTPVRPTQLLQLEALTANGAPYPASLPSVTGEVFEAYEQKKADSNYLSFYDVVLGATGLRSYGWDELIIDEAQDVTSSQLAMLHSFEPQSMTLVGDSGQAIYGFSGVDTELFPKLTSAGWDRVELSKSFRVPAGIIPAVNAARDNPLEAVNSGGSISVVQAPYSELAEALESLLQPGDVVLGSTSRALNRVASRLQMLRPDVPVSCSWNGQQEPGSIYFSTVHSAKGGEWNRVYILDVTAGGIWSPMNSDEDEARRLFYVAASRAQQELILCQIGAELPWGLQL